LNKKLYKAALKKEFLDGFAKRLKKLREKRGLSRKALAAFSNVPAHIIRSFENGRNSTAIPYVEFLADFFGLTVHELVKG